MERKEIKKLLPSGSQRSIAEKTGLSVQTVNQYFAGGNNNIKVELAALEIVADILEQKKSLTDRIKLVC